MSMVSVISVFVAHAPLSAPPTSPQHGGRVAATVSPRLAVFRSPPVWGRCPPFDRLRGQRGVPSTHPVELLLQPVTEARP